MYAEVVVLTYQGPDIGSFTYEIPKDLEKRIKVGHLISVPFGKRNPVGIVLSTDYRLPTTDRPIKPINSIVSAQPFLLPHQIKLLTWMAGYYFAPMVNCFEAALPPLNAKRLPASSLNRRRWQAGLTTNATTRNQKPETRNQTLVLVPTITRIPQIMPLFKSAKNYIFYHNQLKSSERFANWLKILGGNVDYIFGSRSAIFAPCPNIAKIIIFDEHDGAYKDERSPYYDTLTIAEKLQELTGAKLEIVDSSPKITTYFVHKKDITRPIYSSNERRESRSSRQARTIPNIKIVSMAEEHQVGNKSPISSRLSQLLEKIQGQTLLFLNKKAESGQIYCRACNQQNFAAKMPQTCPNCNSPDIFFHSLNIFSLKDEVKKLIPRSAIRLLTEGTRSDYRLLTTDYKLPTIDIATAAIFYASLFEKYNLVAHISVDSLLNIVDFKTAENFYSQIQNLKNLLNENGILILQTYNPQNELLKNAVWGSYRNFYGKELKMRKPLLYPPFSLLVKLTIKGKNKDLIFQRANNLVSELQSIVTKNIIVLGPYEPVFSGKTPRYNIILKRKLNSYDLESKEKATKALSSYISKVPKGWQVTVEPDTLN